MPRRTPTARRSSHRPTMLCQRSLAILFIVNVPIATSTKLGGLTTSGGGQRASEEPEPRDACMMCTENDDGGVPFRTENPRLRNHQRRKQRNVNQDSVTCLEPDFLRPMENITVAKGRDAKFTCVVNNLGGYRVSPSSSAGSDHGGANPRVAWIKADTKAILAIHEHVITNNARLSVTHNDFNTWTLNVKDARPEDRGTYMCQVNTDPMKSQSAHLEVVIPPDIISDDAGDVMVPEGGQAKLFCKARGYPKPEIVWKREDGSEIITRTLSGSKAKVREAHGEVLSFPNVGRSEMGTYLCLASNGVPPTVSKRMTLQVHFRPLIEVPNQLVGAPMGTDVTLSCKVEASPKPINFWTRENGNMIIDNEKYSMSEEKLNTYSSWLQLVIRNLQSRDFGGYKCISKNSLGDAESGIRLYEIALQERKGEHSAGAGDEYSEEREHGSRLNHVYQGSLRESGSTLQPRGNGAAAQPSSSRTSATPMGSPALLVGLLLLLA